MRGSSNVLGGFWMGSGEGLACKLLREWSWRRDLNPRPSDYKPHAQPLSCSIYVVTRAISSPLIVLPGEFWMGIWMGNPRSGSRP